MALLESKDRTVADRLEKWGVKLPDEAGEFARLDKDALLFDTDFYQRDKLSKSTIEAIVKDFNWPSFGVISVAARRSRGGIAYYVLDGMHRVLAARELEYVTLLPAIVHYLDDRKEEAETFDQMNRVRTAVGAIDRFKGEVNRGLKPAVELHTLLHKTGFEVSNTHAANSVVCINRLKAFQRSDWPTLKEVWNLQITPICRGRIVKESIVIALWYIAVKTKGKSLESDWTRRFIELGADAIEQACKRRRYIDNGPIIQSYASAVLELANKGRQKRLKLER